MGVYCLASPMVFWDGQANRPIKVTVRSEEGRVIAGANVSLIQNMDERIKEVISEEEFSKHLVASKHRFESDKTGSGVLKGQFGAGGGSGPFGRTGRFVVSGILTVTHPDYADISLPLANFTDDRRISIRKKELEFTVFMSRKRAEQGGSGLPATRSESDSEGGDNPQPESEGRSR